MPLAPLTADTPPAAVEVLPGDERCQLSYRERTHRGDRAPTATATNVLPDGRPVRTRWHRNGTIFRPMPAAEAVVRKQPRPWRRQPAERWPARALLCAKRGAAGAVGRRRTPSLSRSCALGAAAAGPHRTRSRSSRPVVPRVLKEGSRGPILHASGVLHRCTDDVLSRHLIRASSAGHRRRQGTEHELATARQRFERAFEDAPIGMAIVDLDGRFTEVNRALREFLGRDDAGLVGRHVSRGASP